MSVSVDTYIEGTCFGVRNVSRVLIPSSSENMVREAECGDSMVMLTIAFLPTSVNHILRIPRNLSFLNLRSISRR
jgi:hypothetical protein